MPSVWEDSTTFRTFGSQIAGLGGLDPPFLSLTLLLQTGLAVVDSKFLGLRQLPIKSIKISSLITALSKILKILLVLSLLDMET